MFGSDTAARREVTGSIPARPAPYHVVARPLPPLASADTHGISGGGRGMASYEPSNPEITGSVRPEPPPPPAWTWDGGVAVTVAPGETLDMIARKHGVPVSAIMQANRITDPASIHAGQHLVIPHLAVPRYRPPATAYAPPATRMATAPRFSSVESPRTPLAPSEGVHVVAPGETLSSIGRLYGKSVMALARANNLPPYTMVRVGQRIIIPDAAARPRAEAPPPPRQDIANSESPHSAFKATPVVPQVHETPVAKAEPVGALPGFRWPAHGRVIAAFGRSPNGLQNDGIDLALPVGTPIKAADDGVVAYAGNELQGYGNLVLIRHPNGYVTAYAHASEILVKRGEAVKRGQVIAKSGETGSVKSPELHFEIRKGATPVDPTEFLSGA